MSPFRSARAEWVPPAPDREWHLGRELRYLARTKLEIHPRRVVPAEDGYLEAMVLEAKKPWPLGIAVRLTEQYYDPRWDQVKPSAVKEIGLWEMHLELDSVRIDVFKEGLEGIERCTSVSIDSTNRLQWVPTGLPDIDFGDIERYEMVAAMEKLVATAKPLRAAESEAVLPWLTTQIGRSGNAD